MDADQPEPKSPTTMIDPMQFDQSNPYGPLDPARLERFAARVGAPLPADYSAYLRDHNGGDLKNPNHPQAPEFRVHQMFGLHDGPVHARLDAWHDLRSWYDLKQEPGPWQHFLAFGATTTGDALLIDLRDARVAVYLHDEDAQAIRYLADGFAAFVTSLVSDAAIEAELAEDDDFQRRLAEMEAQRAADVADYLKRQEDT